jgi:predicted ATP-binding protein involved in virulence
MRLDSVHFTNILSFDTFQWDNIDPQTNIIVGPNGTGKTNFMQALRMIMDVMRPVDVMRLNAGLQKSTWPQNTYRGSQQVPIEVRLDIQFTEIWEKHLLCLFLFATLCNDSVIQDIINNLVRQLMRGESLDMKKETEQARFSANLQAQLLSNDDTDDSLLKQLDWLFTGRLVVAYQA